MSISIRKEFNYVHAKLPVRSSLHKRNPTYLGGGKESDVKPATLSVSLSTDHRSGLNATCWLEDEEGRKLGLVISDESVKALIEMLRHAETFKDNPPIPLR